MMERAKLYLCNKLKKVVVALLAWSIVSVNAVWAGEVSRDVSCLSPALHCNSADFSRSVSAYYQDTVLQSKPDLVPGRLQYEKDFFRLTLKTLFPEIIQRQLIRAVRQQLLSGIDKNS
ncbi:MAG: hypothetical protein PHO30_06710, partial [Candidatus Omnitrophica bacterium]|nr:hypothetical protein [Candidatus Omnitrophota bacterium]